MLRSTDRSGGSQGGVVAEIKTGGVAVPAGRAAYEIGAPGGVNGHPRGDADGTGEIRPLSDIERETIVQTLEHFHGHRQKTAKALGIGVRTLGLKLKKWKEEQLVPATL